MSEFEHIKQEVHRLVDEASSEELMEVRNQLLYLKASEPIEISEERRKRLDQAEADSRAGIYASVEEVRSRMEAKFPFLRKES